MKKPRGTLSELDASTGKAIPWFCADCAADPMQVLALVLAKLAPRGESCGVH